LGRRFGDLEHGMRVEKAAASSSLIDVLDRVLDKGIVIDAWVRVAVIGIDVVTVEARIVVASIETYLRYTDVFSPVSPMTRTVKQIAAVGLQLQVADRVPLSPERIVVPRRSSRRTRAS
jgi:hypothetical protein